MVEEDPIIPKRPEVGESSQGELKKTQDELKELESQAGGSAKVKIDRDEHRKRRIDSEEQYVQKTHTGHAGSVVFICATFIVAVVGLLFVSPVLLLINNKEQLVNDLNDGFYAYHTYTNKVLGMQLGGNCNEETIKCKFQTMSPMLKKRFERYDFKVASSVNKATDRHNVQSLVFPDGGGVAVNATTLAVARKNTQSDNLVDRVYSSRTGVYQDQKFYQRLIDQFGLLQENTVTGDTAKKYDESFDRRVAEGDQARYQDSDPGTRDDALDANGRGVYSLKSLADMSDHFGTDIFTNLESKANTHMALACAYATYGNLLENSVKKAKTVTIARYAMNYLSLADYIKSGEASGGYEVGVESLANKLMKADTNGKNAMDADGYRSPAMGELPSDTVGMLQKLSPLQLLLLTAPGAPSVPGSEYLKGALNAVQTSAAGISPSDRCAAGMSGVQSASEQSGLCWSPASMPLANYVSIPAGAAIAGMKDPIEQLVCPIGGVKAVVELVKAAVKTAGEMMLVPPLRIKVAANTESGRYTSSLYGIDAQNAIFAGTGILLGDRAQSLGMRPANAIGLRIYLQQAETARRDAEAQGRAVAKSTPWDATNPNSFLGTIVAKFAPAGSVLPGRSLLVNASSILSLVPTSVVSATQSSAGAAYTQPMHLNTVARMRPASACGIGKPGELDIQIMPDMGCNIRYSMSPEELQADLGQVIDYMTRAHPDNASESLQGTQSRDTLADEPRGSQMKQQAQEGANASYVDRRTGKPNNYTEYAKFMEYCVNRQDPWGGLGMVVQPEAEAPQGSSSAADQDVVSSEPERSKPDEKNVADSYYALGWGSKSDQDWYTGKRCVDDSGKYKEMLKNFRAYTMACGILADLSGSVECWDGDRDLASHDDFYTTNNIIFQTQY